MLVGGSEAAEVFATAAPLPLHVVDILTKAKVCWLKNVELAELLQGYKQFGFQVSPQAPIRPPSGSVFLFDRSTLRFFRKDGYRWRKKADGRTIREAHEKLKVDNKDVLNCYYAQSEEADGLQRRCYWLLEGDGNTVLVHYLAAKQCDRLVLANDLTDRAVPCLTETHEKPGNTPDNPSPFSSATLFPPHTPHLTSPTPRLTQQPSLQTCAQTNSIQAARLDVPDPTFSSNDQAVSLPLLSDKPYSQQHSPASLGSLVLSGKPIALDSRTASAPISASQDPRLAWRHDQAYVKRTRSDSAQYVQRNISNLAAADRSLDAYEAWQQSEQSGLIATHVELEPPAKRQQLNNAAGLPSHFCASQATRAQALPDQAQSQLRQLVHSPQHGVRAQQPSDDRAVPTMAPCPPHSPLGQSPLRSFLGRPPYQRPASLDPRVVLRQAQQHNQQQQMQQPRSNRQLQSYMQSQPHAAGCLHPQLDVESSTQSQAILFGQAHGQVDCDCHLQLSPELISNTSASPLHSAYNQLQSQAGPWRQSTPGPYQGIFSQQPLTPDFRPTPTRQIFSRWDGATDGIPVCTSPEQASRQKLAMLPPSSLTARSLTAHLAAQQQAGTQCQITGNPTLRKYSFASSPGMMQMEHALCHEKASVEKPFGNPSSPNTSSPWMQHLPPDLLALEATVPHVTSYNSPGLE